MADELAPEVVATASSRVAAALAKDNPPAQHHRPATSDEPAHVPLPPQPPQQTTLPGTAPAGEPATQAGEKRTRTTVAKLLQRYQEREAETDAAITSVERHILVLQMDLDQHRAKKKFLREMIEEINAD